MARLAAALVKDWKKHFKAKLDRPMIEVRCDRKTEQLREAGRKLLTKSFKGEVGHTIYSDFRLSDDF